MHFICLEIEKNRYHSNVPVLFKKRFRLCGDEVDNARVPLLKDWWGFRTLPPLILFRGYQTKVGRGLSDAPNVLLEHFYFKVDPGRKTQVRENISRLAAWFDDINQSLMNPHFELIARVLVNEG